MINTFDFPEGAGLLRHAPPVARTILRLKKRLKRHGVPVLYANDNFGQWRSDWQRIYQVCAQADQRGAPAAVCAPSSSAPVRARPSERARGVVHR